MRVWDKGNRDACVFECRSFDKTRRRWLTVWHLLDEKKLTMDVIKGYVEVNNEAERETISYLGEVWTGQSENNTILYIFFR